MKKRTLTSARRRHPSDTEFRRNPLSILILECGRSRPDSSRQDKAKQRAKVLKQARAVKQAPVVIVAPPDLTDCRQNRFSW